MINSHWARAFVLLLVTYGIEVVWMTLELVGNGHLIPLREWVFPWFAGAITALAVVRLTP